MSRPKSGQEASEKAPVPLHGGSSGIFKNNVTDMRYHNAVDETRIKTKEFINQLRTVFSTIDILFSGIAYQSS